MIYRPGFGDGSPEGWVEACPGGERFNCVAVSFDGAPAATQLSHLRWYEQNAGLVCVCPT